MGWLTYQSELPLEIFLLYGAGIFWTLGYDTIYAYQDREDDVLVGIKSSALAIGDHPRGVLGSFYGLMILLLCSVGYLSTLAWPFYVGVFVVALQLLWQILTLDIQTPANCWKRFTSNAEVGLIIFFSIMVGHVLK
jgi:4-hydroxybenzoate polyprenyltransferase